MHGDQGGGQERGKNGVRPILGFGSFSKERSEARSRPNFFGSKAESGPKPFPSPCTLFLSLMNLFLKKLFFSKFTEKRIILYRNVT